MPVLFVPGNAGSYKQVRSLGAVSARYFDEKDRRYYGDLPRFEHWEKGVEGHSFFSIDFGEELSVLSGRTLYDQTEYVNDCIRYILSLYEGKGEKKRVSCY